MSNINPAVAQRSKPGFATADDPDTIFELTKKIGKGHVSSSTCSLVSSAAHAELQWLR